MIRRRLAVGLLLFGLSSPLAAAGLVKCWTEQETSPFEDGIACFHARSWSQAIPWFELAIEKESAANLDAYFNLHGKLTTYRYLPYYLLGRSYRELEDCPSALEYFERSCDQGEVKKKTGLLRRLNQQSRECRQRTGAPETKECGE